MFPGKFNVKPPSRIMTVPQMNSLVARVRIT